MQETLTYAVDGLAISVKFDRWDALQNDRARWFWRIEETTHAAGWYRPSSVLAEGDDLTTVGAAAQPSAALASLAGFLSAWLEAVEYVERTGRESENIGLFPRHLLDKVDRDTFDQIVTGLAMALEPESV